MLITAVKGDSGILNAYIYKQAAKRLKQTDTEEHSGVKEPCFVDLSNPMQVSVTQVDDHFF